MAKDHYLPATFIGRFSDDKSASAREREIWTYNSKAGKLLCLAASAIGYRRGLYDLSGGRSIDAWDYEGPLNTILDALAQPKRIALDDWVHVLVPFVTGLFVRGKEFNQRYESIPIIRELTDEGRLPPDNTNISRAIRLNRQLAPVMAARWVVLHSNGKVPLISNDIGLVPTQDKLSGDEGWAIPLDTSTILGIFPGVSRHIATYNNAAWEAEIEHYYPPPDMFDDFNHHIASAAPEFIYGPTRESIEPHIPAAKSAKPFTPQIMEAAWEPVSDRELLVAHAPAWAITAIIANLNLSPFQAMHHTYDIGDLSPDKWVPTIAALPAPELTRREGIEFRDVMMGLNLHSHR